MPREKHDFIGKYTFITNPVDIPLKQTMLAQASVDVSAVDGIGQKQLMVSEVGQW